MFNSIAANAKSKIIQRNPASMLYFWPSDRTDQGHLWDRKTPLCHLQVKHVDLKLLFQGDYDTMCKLCKYVLNVMKRKVM